MSKPANAPHAAALIYPHQLFETQPALAGADCAVLVEDPLFFSQYAFHRQKLMLHRASLKAYAAELTARKVKVHYVEAHELENTEAIAPLLKKLKITRAQLVDPSDDWLFRKVSEALKAAKIDLMVFDDPDFLTSRPQIEGYVKGRKKLFFADFYSHQRKRLGILLENGKPVGGKWSFDTENRKRLPATVTLPKMPNVEPDAFSREARAYVEKKFPKALGEARDLQFPWLRDQAQRWLRDFVNHRLTDFGDYEDAITTRSPFLFHSVLTPALNLGLLSPDDIVKAVLKKAPKVPLNSLEGFIRQVIGWREYIRLVYLTHGRAQRTRNFWKMKRRLPKAFYDGTTGIEPVDSVIRSVLKHGYCHHIERLMILGNFMLLCGIDPDDTYRWFMELFVDAYDWVMVPNVYGMSQHADGGFMTTKPYLSGSAYVLKMSDFKKGEWCTVWDALYWTFIDRHDKFFSQNPRMMVMVKMRDKLGPKLDVHRKVAQDFLKRLHAD